MCNSYSSDLDVGRRPISKSKYLHELDFGATHFRAVVLQIWHTIWRGIIVTYRAQSKLGNLVVPR